MLVIRLQRTGRKGHAQFRVVVQDSRRTPSSGKIVAALGHYNPHNKEIVVNKEKAKAEGLAAAAAELEKVKAEVVRLTSELETATTGQTTLSEQIATPIVTGKQPRQCFQPGKLPKVK